MIAWWFLACGRSAARPYGWDARILSLHVSQLADARRCVSAGENMGFASQNRHFHNAKQAFLKCEKGVVEEGIDRLWRFRREEGDSQHSLWVYTRKHLKLRYLLHALFNLRFDTPCLGEYFLTEYSEPTCMAVLCQLHPQEVAKVHMLYSIDITAAGPFIQADNIFGIVVVNGF